ncbi:MAG: peptidoglycan DD-metalloendopeptidase family protein [Acetatifactor sp.]|nr:peptidoglycan DD-metalloendopeptidase family protein [Acetatifactor sp.]
MHRRKHKRKKNHVVIVTSDAVDVGMKQYRIRSWVSRTITFVLCVLIGMVIGYFVYEERIWGAALSQNSEQSAALQALEEEKAALQGEVEALNEQIRILSATVNEKVQSESELTAQLEQQSTPSKLPLTGAASVEEVSEGDPMCIFTASVGSMVVATASGTVMSVNDDVDYGHNVWIDHGNGYITIYRNKGEATVKQGDSVVQGTTLFVIGKDNNKLGYQMMKDNSYIDPMELLSISG